MVDWRGIVLGLVAVTLALAVPAPASGAVTIGSTLANPPNAFQGSSFAVTFINTANPAPLLASTGGVVVRWRVRDGNHPDDVQVKLRVLAPNAGFTAVTGAGTSATGTLSGSNGASDAMAPVLTFPTQLPIAAGSTIGLELDGNGRLRSTGLSDLFRSTVVPSPADGGTSPVPGGDSGVEFLFNADIEPDCDNDRLGDETQDRSLPTPPCPTALACKGKRLTIAGTNGPDQIVGTDNRDVIGALDGSDKVSGLAGNDVLCGGPGSDTLKGGTGKDALLGQRGKDRLNGGGAKDLCKGGKGEDTAKACDIEKSI